MERRAWGTQGLEIRSEEERILSGVVVPFDTPTKIGSYTEEFRAGAFVGTDPATIPLLTGHDHASLPVGATLSLNEEPHALTGEWRVAQTQAGDEVMALARDGVPLSLSVGFRPIADEWNGTRTHVVRAKATLGEVSVVSLGAYEAAKVTSVRDAEDEPDMPRLRETLRTPKVLDRAPRLTIARLIRP